MSERPSTRLCDHAQAIAELLPLLEALYPPANLSDPKSMMYEDKRLELASIAGKHLVVQDLRAALVQNKNEKHKSKVTQELV